MSVEATAVLRLVAVIDNLRGKTSAPAEITRLSARLLLPASKGRDTSAWTANQKAAAILRYLFDHLAATVTDAATAQEKAGIQAAIDAAIADLN